MILLLNCVIVIISRYIFFSLPSKKTLDKTLFVVLFPSFSLELTLFFLKILQLFLESFQLLITTVSGLLYFITFVSLFLCPIEPLSKLKTQNSVLKTSNSHPLINSFTNYYIITLTNCYIRKISFLKGVSTNPLIN